MTNLTLFRDNVRVLGLKMTTSLDSSYDIGFTVATITKSKTYTFTSDSPLVGFFGQESAYGITSFGPIRVDLACTTFPDILDPSYALAPPATVEESPAPQPVTVSYEPDVEAV